MEDVIERLFRKAKIPNIAGDKIHRVQSIEFRIIRQELFRIAGKDGNLQIRSKTAFAHGKDALSEKSRSAGEKYRLLIHTAKLSFLINGIGFAFEPHVF